MAGKFAGKNVRSGVNGLIKLVKKHLQLTVIGDDFSRFIFSKKIFCFIYSA